jgi:hypothetical protein
MIRKIHLALASFVLVALVAGRAHAQGTEAPYTEGTVWEMTFVRTTTGLDDDYLKSLGSSYKKVMEEAKKQDLIVSYHIIAADPANENDWNLMLMVEYKNMAALDGLDAKFRAIEAKIVGNEDAQRKMAVKRLDVRKILGNRLGREIFLK